MARFSPISWAARGAALKCMLRRDESGATVVEFALVVLPFTALMFAIIETALLFLAGQTLETAVGDAGRLIRTGQAQKASYDAAAMKTAICDHAPAMFKCEANLKVDVRTSATFDSINLDQPVVDGDLKDDNFTYDDGKGGEIVVVRAFYEWPTFVHLLGQDYSTLANGKHLLAATAAFKNEPFPW
ncbi:MAG: TadE/TadG family type IV pilus assembly protein [Bauldia sp.]